VICGEGPEREMLEAFQKREGLEEQIVLAGYVPRVEEYLAKSKLFVLTSRAEGLPMCLLEARACGVPCVSFDVPTGPSDMIEEGVNGHLIVPFDCKDMAEKIETLLANPERLAAMGEKAGEDLDAFWLPEIIRQWKQLINTLLE